MSTAQDTEVTATQQRRGPSGRVVALVALLVTLVVAGIVSFYASSSPDGLEKVSEEQGFHTTAKNSAVADSPLADYSTRGVDDQRLSGGLAGVIGVVVVLAVAGLLFWVVRRRSGGSGTSSTHASPAAGTEP